MPEKRKWQGRSGRRREKSTVQGFHAEKEAEQAEWEKMDVDADGMG